MKHSHFLASTTEALRNTILSASETFFWNSEIYRKEHWNYQKCCHLLYSAFSFLFDMYELQTIPIFSVNACLIKQNLGALKQRAEAVAFLF